MNNWGLLTNTETKERYIYIGKQSKSNASIGEIECHRLKGVGENSRYGKSYLDYYYHEDYGFTEMNYLSYDGDIITFKIIGIEFVE